MYGTLRWNAVTTNVDLTPITDLAGYYVYHGFVTTIYDPGIFVAAPTTQYLFTGLEVGITHYFNVKAADTSGNLSTFGGEVTLRNEIPIYQQDRRLDQLARYAQRQWNTDTSNMVSGFIADVLGLNIIPPPPPPPEDYPLYSPIGGFMIV